MHRHYRALPAILTVFCTTISTCVHAVETDTSPQLGFRAATTLADKSTLDFTVSYRAIEGFTAHDREIAEVRYGRKYGDNELSAAYHIEFDRRGSLGSDHRLWLQGKHQFSLQQSSIETSLRLEERYFDATYLHGERVRWATRWVKPLTKTDQIRFGYELVYNLNDISKTTENGDAQDRLIGTIQHNLSNGNRVEFEWMARYMHIPHAANMLVNQFSLLYVYNF